MSEGETVTANIFGGDWTREKLRLIGAYLKDFNKVLKNQPFERWYVDGFAGPGFSSAADGDEAELLQGSPLIALATDPPFDRLLFVDRVKANAEQLRATIQQAPMPDRTQVICGDANEELIRFAGNMRTDQRAVVFLDPFSMDVRWATVEALAATKKCDVWFLFPVGAVNRLLTRTGTRDRAWDEALNKVLGCNDWDKTFYRSEGPDLFGQEVIRKTATCEDIAEFYRRRLNDLFPGGAANHYRMLKNSKGSPLFALMFALGNPSPKARGAALRIANHILDRL